MKAGIHCMPLRFVSDSEAQNILGVDRITLEQLIKSGSLKAVSATGEHTHFFRTADVEKLRDTLPKPQSNQTASDNLAPSQGKKQRPPAMKVHIRLQADLKWFDVTDDDMLAWFQQLSPNAYDQNIKNLRAHIARMQKIINLIEEGEKQLSADVSAEKS